ncbi:MAG: hypothetical protein CAF45_011525 [Nitrospira sp. CG24E]|nr:MAG: hypothetical protein CAF45_011525 [Nitrospira sp. CG24E]
MESILGRPSFHPACLHPSATQADQPLVLVAVNSLLLNALDQVSGAMLIIVVIGLTVDETLYAPLGTAPIPQCGTALQ